MLFRMPPGARALRRLGVLQDTLDGHYDGRYERQSDQLTAAGRSAHSIVVPSLAAAAGSSQLPKPVAHWPLDSFAAGPLGMGPYPKGRPVALDVAGLHNGVIVGATVAKGSRVLRQGALRFTAAKGDHVAVPYSPDFELNDFTVCAWVRLLPRTRDSGPADVLGGVLGTREFPITA